MAKRSRRRLVKVKELKRRVPNLQVFLRTRGEGERGRTLREKFAKKCGTSLPYLYQVALGMRTPSLALAFRIERESSGIVSAENLVPNADWSYIQSRSNSSAAASA